jgi:GNAT superfamily N-acetyltransferase
MGSQSCGYWYHGECEGTPLCPPRCPRFVDRRDRPTIVRPATTDDLESLVEMYRSYPDSDRSMGIPPRVEPRIRSWLNRLFERGRNFVATANGRDVLGHSCYAPTTADVPEMLVYVAPDEHGRGLGTELTKHVLAYAAEEDHDAVALDVARENAAAIGLYRDLGFERTDETPTEYEMELSTDAPIALYVRRPPAERDV